MCSFCSKGNLNVDLMIAGPPPLAICSSCLDAEDPKKLSRDATEYNTCTPQRCDFCQKTNHLIIKQSQSIALCSDCITLCLEIIDRRRRIRQLSTLLASESPNIEAHLERGKLNLEENQLAIAIADFTRILDLSPEQVEVLALRAQCYLKNGQITAALADINQSLNLQPDNCNHLAIAAKIHAENKNWPSAIEELTKAINLQPNETDTLISRGYYLLQAEKYHEAIVDCTKVIESGAKEAVAYNNRAKANIFLNRHAEALPDLETAIALDSENYPIFFYNLGCTQAILGNHQEAVAQISIAIKMESTEAKYYVARAESYDNLKAQSLAEADRKLAARLLQN
jgi:tetratricopeptide (TPR) repeat protein